MKKHSAILAIGSYLPEKVITNSDIEKMVDTNDEWIRTRTGIRERRQAAKGENASDMAAKASQQAIDNAGINPDDIELIICTSLSPDQLCPSTASLIQKKLGLKNAAAFDLSAACAGFAFALTTAVNFIEAGMYKNVLVVGTEALSRLIDWKDRNTCILFGDGSGAVVVGQADEPYGVLGSYLASDGSKSDLIEIPAGGSAMPASAETIQNNKHYLQMKGGEVFKFAVRVIPHAIQNAIDAAQISIDDVDLIIPHQANIRIIEAAAKKLGLPMDKFFTNLEFLGNTSTASVPLALQQAIKSSRLKKGDLVVIVGFGAGLSWGANAIRWAY